MTLRHLAQWIVPACFVALSPVVQAADDTTSGNIRFHNDVVQIDFTLLSASDVKIWSDSWLSGLNIDPAAQVWRRTANDFVLVSEVDDDDTIAPGQGYYDTGFSLPMLAAGEYRFTLVAALNAAQGTLLSQGFTYDRDVPIEVGSWNQPTYDPNANDQKGTWWQVHFSNVSQVNVVPEPSSWMLLGFGVVALLASRSRR